MLATLRFSHHYSTNPQFNSPSKFIQLNLKPNFSFQFFFYISCRRLHIELFLAFAYLSFETTLFTACSIHNKMRLLSRKATCNTHGQDSSYFLGWQEYEKNPYDEIKNPTGIIQMGLAENQVRKPCMCVGVGVGVLE